MEERATGAVRVAVAGDVATAVDTLGQRQPIELLRGSMLRLRLSPARYSWWRPSVPRYWAAPINPGAAFLAAAADDPQIAPTLTIDGKRGQSRSHGRRRR